MMFDHLGVVVPDLAHGRAMLSGALGIRRWTAEFDDPLNDVFVQFGQCESGICYEAIAPRSPASPVRNALKRHVNILNHVAYRVGELACETARLEHSGFRAIGEARPAIAYDNHMIQFFMNADMFMVELIEAPAHRHSYVEQA
jgi:methylmalonyl-CoA/ethylmalonyl-CoA epimerase